MLDRPGIIRSWNEGAQRLKGYREEEILGKHFSIFYPERDRMWDKPRYELRVASEEGQFEEEGWRVRKEGSEFWASVLITRILDDQGKLLGFSKITRDLTDKKNTEDQIRKLN